MPHTAKGNEILHSMENTYGSQEKAEQVLHASANAGTISGIDTTHSNTVPAGVKKMTEIADPLQAGKDVAPRDAFVVGDYK